MSELFLDSNICVYGFDRSDLAKQDKALLLLKGTSKNSKIDQFY